MEELSFSVPLPEKTVEVKILSFEKSVFIWVGEADCKFDHLNIATGTRYSSSPSSVVLLGANTGTIIHKLTKRLGKQVLLSYNVEMDVMNPGFTEDIISKTIISKLTKTQKAEA